MYQKIYLLKKEIMHLVTYGLVSLYNGISAFVGYSILKLALQENCINTDQPIAGGYKGIDAFPKVLVRNRT